MMYLSTKLHVVISQKRYISTKIHCVITQKRYLSTELQGITRHDVSVHQTTKCHIPPNYTASYNKRWFLSTKLHDVIYQKIFLSTERRHIRGNLSLYQTAQKYTELLDVWTFSIVRYSKEYNFSETGSVSVLRWRGGEKIRTQLGPLVRADFNHWTAPLHLRTNRSSFRNVVFSSL
jgi:hypothetical protein